MMELITNPWVTYTGIALLALIMGMYVGNLNSESDHDEIEELAYEKSVLQTEISNLENQWKEEKNKVYELKEEFDRIVEDTNIINKGVNFTKVQLDALDLYDRAGVRIPVDILEELSYNKDMNTVTEVKHFIEMQRANWKLENSKKI